MPNQPLQRGFSDLYRVFSAIVVPLVASVVTFGVASSEVGASNAVRAIPVPYRAVLSGGVAMLAFTIHWKGRAVVRAIPHEQRRITWAALTGWALACFSGAVLLSSYHAFYLAVALGRHERMLTPPDWILSRAILGGFAMTIFAWMIILRTRVGEWRFV